MKNVLAIDSSTSCATLALASDGNRFHEQIEGQQTHAKILPSAIDRLLVSAGLRVADLDAIVFGQGPGSFTGLRVACSIAKGLAFAHDIPLMPVSTLAAIAFQAREQSNQPRKSVLAVIDARMDELYWRADRFEQPAEEAVNAAKDIYLPDDGEWILAGTGFEPYLSAMNPELLQRLQSRLLLHPDARAMLALALAGNADKITAAAARPVYIRNKVTQGGTRG